MDEGNGLNGHELAQLNIGRMLAPLDSPLLKGFADGLDHINALAEAAPGFSWRLKDDETDDATSIRMFEDDWILVNMSVWQSQETLRAFVYDDAHRSYLRRRREWFERLDEAITVLWWVPTGHRPSVAEARDRLEHLRKHGTTPYAFGFGPGDAVPAPPPGVDYTPYA